MKSVSNSICGLEQEQGQINSMKTVKGIIYLWMRYFQNLESLLLDFFLLPEENYNFTEY